MFIELHILQNFAPSNLNRDETGAPKSCLFGDVPRARFSSQSSKRAARDYVEEKKLLDPQILGKRSKLIEGKFKRFLVDEFKKDEEQAGQIAHLVARISGWKKETEKEESGALQFLGLSTLKSLAEFCDTNWSVFDEYLQLKAEEKSLKPQNSSLNDEINQLKEKELKDPNVAKERESKEKEKEKIDKRLNTITKDIEKAKGKVKNFEMRGKDGEKSKFEAEVEAIVGAKRTPDIAMFGRMMADAPRFAIDAASQVAHAISTHAVASGDYDYFTAIDELKKESDPNADAGAAMIGTIDFNSACYYRYLNIDTKCLEDNLKDTEKPRDLARETVKAFLQSFVIAVPSGKQNSFASPTLPTFILGVVREGYGCSLANAFATPIRLQDKDEIGIVEKSIQKMTKHFFCKERMYGKNVGTRYGTFCSDSGDEFLFKPQENNGATIKLDESFSLDELIENLTNQAFYQSNGESQ